MRQVFACYSKLSSRMCFGKFVLRQETEGWSAKAGLEMTTLPPYCLFCRIIGTLHRHIMRNVFAVFSNLSMRIPRYKRSRLACLPTGPMTHSREHADPQIRRRLMPKL